MTKSNEIKSWEELCNILSAKFGIDVDFTGVLFLVGVREKGLVLQKFTKEEKLNLINLGSCILYTEAGLLERTGTDHDGWPVFHQNALAPQIDENRKKKTLQDCAIRYFQKIFHEETN